MLKDLGKSVLFYGLASSISKFVGIFLVPLFTFYYSPAEYGVLDLISSIISFIAILGMMQLESAISRYYYEVEGHDRAVYISTAFWTILIVSLFFALLGILLASTISEMIFDSTKYSNLFRLACINIVLLNLFGFFTVLLRFANKPLGYGGIIFTQFIVTLVVSWICLQYETFGLYPFFIGQIAGLTVSLSLMIINFRKELLPRIDLKILSQFLYYSLPQIPAVAGNWVNMYINRFIMLEFLTVSEIGIYAVALKIASIFNLIDSSFRMAWEPFIWKKVSSPDHIPFIRDISNFITPILLVIALLFMMFEQELITIFSSSEYYSALPISRIIVIALVFPILIQIYGIGNSIATKTIFNTVSFLTGMVCNVISLFLLVPRIGLIGVPLSLVISNFISLALMLFFAERNYRIGFNLKFLILYLFGFIICATVVYYMNIHLNYRIIIVLILGFTGWIWSRGVIKKFL